MENVLRAIVQVYLPERGYGYLRLPDTAECYLFRTDQLRDTVQRGDWVSFRLRSGPQGYYATNIRLLRLA